MIVNGVSGVIGISCITIMDNHVYSGPEQRTSRARRKAQPPHQKTAGGGSLMEGTSIIHGHNMHMSDSDSLK